jgi:DeoR/GlpR family transcriptional regulator of sugar metabolism
LHNVLIRATTCKTLHAPKDRTMLSTQRKAVLLTRLRAEGRLVATELATELGLSEDTIRRDLRDLAAEGLLVRVHGGALPASPTNIPLARRRDLQTDAKRRLAQATLRLLRPGMTVLVDGGTTTQALVAALDPGIALTVVTHSPGIALALEGHSQVDVVLVGGRLFRHSMVACGPEAQAGFARVRADVCLLGVTGVHPQTGLTTGDPEEAVLKRTMMESAAETLLMATPDKIGVSGVWMIAPLQRLGTLVSVGGRPDWLPPGVAHLGA